MNMLTTTPVQGGFTQLLDRVNRMVPELFDSADLRQDLRTWTPPMDVVDTPEALLVRVELPGIDPATVETTLAGGYLEISGEKPAPERIDSSKWYRFERSAGSFVRRIHLPYPVDADRIEATANHGLMTIRLPKPAEVLPRKIEIKVTS